MQLEGADKRQLASDNHNNNKRRIMSSRSCILVVGSTGTGKSTLIGMCTGLSVATSGGANECTQDIQAFEDEEGLMWIDSVGFDGTDSTILTNKSSN